MITAIVLATGLSTRMGQPKLLLPFDGQTIVEHIVSVLLTCPVDAIWVVTGHAREAVEQRLAGRPVRMVFNPQYATGEMLSSIQAGLRAAPPEARAALIVLGDQPALDRSVVGQIVAAYRDGRGSIVVPSYQRRRGHPLLIDRKHWGAILALAGGETLREFFQKAGGAIHHVEVTEPGVLRDVDTPDEYQNELADYRRRRQGQ